MEDTPTAGAPLDMDAQEHTHAPQQLSGAPQRRTALIAPWWHTLALLSGLALFAVLGHTRTQGIEAGSRVALYASQMLTSWMLFGAVVAGVLHRRTFFFETLQRRAKTWRIEFGRGLAIYAGFLSTMMAVFFVIVVSTTALRSFAHTPAKPAQTQTQSGTAASGPTAPDSVAEPDFVKPPDLARFGFKPKVVAALAPRTWPQLLLWVLISITAGFAEEHIFRGYFLQQALALMSRTSAPLWLGRTLAVVISASIFGSLHLYEGVGGAALIAVLGAVYAVLALALGNLRAVIIAHFLQDFIAGCLLFFLRSHPLP